MDTAGLNWHKSSYSSGNGGNCVETADLEDGGTAVRNSRFPDGPVLEFTEGEWRAFLLGAIGGEFGQPH